MATLGFAGFLRWDDLSQIKACDIDFHLNFMKIFLEKRKNDQFREGHGFILLKLKRNIAQLVY